MAKIKIGENFWELTLSIQKELWLDDESELYNKDKSQAEITQLHISNNLKHGTAGTLNANLKSLESNESKAFKFTYESGRIEVVVFENQVELNQAIRYTLLSKKSSWDGWDELINSKEYKESYMNRYVLMNEQEVADYKAGATKALNSFKKRLATALEKTPEKFHIRGYWANR